VTAVQNAMLEHANDTFLVDGFPRSAEQAEVPPPTHTLSYARGPGPTEFWTYVPELRDAPPFHGITTTHAASKDARLFARRNLRGALRRPQRCCFTTAQRTS